MTSINIAAISARLLAATPGPWTNELREVWTANGTHCICDAYVDEIESGECSDAIFIAHAPADIAALLAEVERLNGIYASAVNGRAEMRTALMEERKKRPLGITEWSTVENVERVIAERDAANAKLAEACEHIERMATEGVSRACGDDDAFAFLKTIDPKRWGDE